MSARSPVRGTVMRAVIIAVMLANAAYAWSSAREWSAFRRTLHDELKPTTLTNCRLERLGEAGDGGYLMCGNLLNTAQAAYSYGIAGFDQWGCDIAARLKTTTHEYDCFDATRPVCANATLTFHDECVGPRTESRGGRAFDSVERQVARNGDAAQHLIVKMDVEGAEWESLLAVSDAQLSRIDQLAIELHGLPPLALQVVRRLKQFFHVASVHFNNNTCHASLYPFPGWAFEVLFVSRRIAEAAGGDEVPPPSPLLAPADPALPDCQGTWVARRTSSALRLNLGWWRAWPRICRSELARLAGRPMIEYANHARSLGPRHHLHGPLLPAARRDAGPSVARPDDLSREGPRTTAAR